MKNIFSTRTLIALAFVVFGLGLGLVQQVRNRTADLVLRDVPLRVLVSDSTAERFRGLSGREKLSPYDGMIFLFPNPGRHGIVMRDMRFPLDIIWLRSGVVIDMVERAALEPGRSEQELTVYYPRIDATTILELPAGFVSTHQIKIGDSLRDALANPS